MRGLALLPILLIAACATTPGPAAGRLPFHVAIVPCEVEAREVPDGDAEYAKIAENRRLALAIDEPHASAAFLRALAGERFCRVTLLQRPAAEATRSGQSDEEQYLAQAAAIGADLLLVPRISFSPRGWSEPNEKFWLNLPLFLIGGPACYFVADRSCHVEVELSATLHDLAPVAEGRAEIGRGSRLLSAHAQKQTIDFDFIDRAGGSPWLYGTSLLIPAGWVATNGEHVEQQLAASVEESLADELDALVATHAVELIKARGLARFHFDSTESRPRAVREADGAVRFRGDLLLQPGDGVDRLSDWELVAGDVATSGEFNEASPQPAEPVAGFAAAPLRYSIDAAVAAPADATVVRLFVADGSRSRNLRTFTFPVE